MNPQATLSPQPQAGAPIQPQAATVSPQGAAGQVPLQAPTPPVLPQGQTPVASPGAVQQPNFNMGQTLQAIGSYYGIPRQTTEAVNAGNTQANIASANFQQQQAENKIKIQNQQNQLNPSAYQFSKNKDGTVTILNSVGDQVSIGTYAALTGENPAEALQNAGATDPASQRFIAAYNNMQTFVQDKIAAQNGDEQAVAELGDFYKANPGLQNIELGQLQTEFMNQYGSYFGQPTSGQGLGQGISPTLTSANNPQTTSAYENQALYGSASATNPYEQSLQNAAGGGGSLYQALQATNPNGG